MTQHYLRPEELPFQAAERSHVTILFGGLTWKHEMMIQSVLRRSGLQCQRLPEPDRLGHEIGKEYCSSGLCNPAYFTVGNLIQYLRVLERTQSREEIVRNYLFFSAGSDGPCRFGMYEAEFRAALNAAGYNGFRVLGFQQDQGVNASSGHSGMNFTVDFGMDALHAFILGDLLNTLHRRLRPYEANDGDAERTVQSIAAAVARTLEKNPRFELAEAAPQFLRPLLERHQRLARLPHRQHGGQDFDPSLRQAFSGSADPVPPVAERNGDGLAAGETGGQGDRRILGAGNRRRRQLPDVPASWKKRARRFRSNRSATGCCTCSTSSSSAASSAAGC